MNSTPGPTESEREMSCKGLTTNLDPPDWTDHNAKQLFLDSASPLLPVAGCPYNESNSYFRVLNQQVFKQPDRKHSASPFLQNGYLSLTHLSFTSV